MHRYHVNFQAQLPGETAPSIKTVPLETGRRLDLNDPATYVGQANQLAAKTGIDVKILGILPA